MRRVRCGVKVGNNVGDGSRIQGSNRLRFTESDDSAMIFINVCKTLGTRGIRGGDCDVRRVSIGGRHVNIIKSAAELTIGLDQEERGAMVRVSMVVEGVDVTFVKKLKMVRKASRVCEGWSFMIWTEEKCLKEEKKFPKRVGRCFGRGFVKEVIRYRDCCLADGFAEKMS